MPRALEPCLLLLVLFVGCSSNPPAKVLSDGAKTASPKPDPEDGPPPDPNAEPLFTAATHVCRLVEHRDDGVLAVAFVPEFFDTTPPAKLDAALYEVRGALGHCGPQMAVVQRASPLEGVVAVLCEHGVLLLSIGLSTASYRPMMTLGLDMRPGKTLRDVR
jgi:hypothetical protein